MRADARLFRIMAVLGLNQPSFVERCRRIGADFKTLSSRYPTAVLPNIEIFAHHLEYRQPARVFNSSRTYGCPIRVGNFRELFALTEMAG